MKKVLLFMSILILISSCSSLMETKFTPYPGYHQITPTEKVDVYTIPPADKQYIQIGEIKSEGFSDEAVQSRIIMKAKEIGADGVIIVEKIDKSKDLPGLRIWRVVAIKYK